MINIVDIQLKIQQLDKQIEKITHENIAVAFSGGVDSSVLLKKACLLASKNNTKVYAITVGTNLHSKEESHISEELAKSYGAEFILLKIDALQESGIENNPIDRCYLCKKVIFEKIKSEASKHNAKVIIEGTNEDDLHCYRPGIKAIKELKVISPLADNHLTKQEIRYMARELNLSVAEKPSSPCMVTRFPYGEKITLKKIEKAIKAEEFLKEIGLYNIRVRIHGNIARIEIDTDYFDKFLESRDKIITYFKDLKFDYITLDIEGFRSGSMDINQL